MIHQSRRTTILAVEDDLSTRAALFSLLADQSFDVTRAASAEAAIAALQDQEFDLVLTDERLPDSTGVWMATRAYQEHHVRVLLFTDDPTAQTNGWMTVLRKPLGGRQLVRAIRAMQRKAALEWKTRGWPEVEPAQQTV